MDNPGLLGKITDHQRTDTVAFRFRQKRYEFFKRLATSVGRPLKILDVGGTQTIWERIGFADQPDIQITILNIVPVPVDHSNMTAIQGSACSMSQFLDRQFDIVFSNSVIEHVGGDREVRSMANEIRRVGKSYYVQTPNRYFPVEPHFVFPLFQFLPIRVRAALVHAFPLGWFPRIHDRKEAEAAVRSINLLSKSQVRSLFPDAETAEERIFGMTKSIQAYSFSSAASNPSARA
jgi:ubiquinone/menaquinone biosynthesis C-methylase UbiE